MENIKISNFRKIKETWDLDLAPVTFFTGKNNSGKSTILKSLLLLEDYINSNNHFELNFNGENAKKHKIDCYDNAINRINKSHSQKDLFFEYTNNGFSVSLWFQPNSEKANGSGRLMGLDVVRDDKAKLSIRNKGGFEYQIEFDNTLIESNSKLKSNDKNLKDLALVHTIKNLLSDDHQELEKLKLSREDIRNEISFLNSKIANDTFGEEPSNLRSQSDISSIRLSKVLKDFNLSIDTVKAFLNSKEIKIKGKPTEKIDISTYKILKGEFSSNAGIEKDKNYNDIRSRVLAEKLKLHNQKIISLNQEILDSKKKLRIAIKNLENNESLKEEAIVYRPSFSLDDFHPSERTIERVLRRVLQNYLRDNDRSIKLEGVRGALSRAYRLGDRINTAMFFTVEHLSPHRNNQTRLYINSDSSTDINSIIKENSNNPINKKSKAGMFLKKWMVEFDIGDDYKITPIDGVAAKIEIFENKSWFNLADKGFGAGQVFSILFKISLCINYTSKDSKFRYSQRRQQLIVIEEPEANLHPAFQRRLAAMFLDASSRFGIQFIIETHSEYLIRETQKLHIDNKNTFGVYYFDEDEPYQLNYKQDGSFDKNFGDGFLDVVDDIALEMFLKNSKGI
ncbi:AAA family ATPase [Dokdonia genika]|uniref:AAA family ATPase n=1 Tax=Dokdonia genika TaxID=308113 RepID=A0ABV9LCH3_9FLAO